MKWLGVLLVVGACSSNRHVQVGPKPIVAGDSFDSVVATSGDKKDCKIIESYQYCNFGDKRVGVFKDQKFVEYLALAPEPLNFKIHVQTVDKLPADKKKVFVTTLKSKYWDQVRPLIKSIFVANGLTVVGTQKEAEMTVQAEYGFSKKSSKVRMQKWGDKKSTNKVNNHTRFLRLVSMDPSKKKPWRLTVRSSGPTDDLGLVLPVLTAAAMDSLQSDTNTTISGIMSENNVSVLGIRHFSDTQK